MVEQYRYVTLFMDIFTHIEDDTIYNKAEASFGELNPKGLKICNSILKYSRQVKIEQSLPDSILRENVDFFNI
jgi:hypothetical protein